MFPLGLHALQRGRNSFPAPDVSSVWWEPYFWTRPGLSLFLSVFPEETWWRKWTSLAQHLSPPFLWEPAGPWKARAPGCPPQDLSCAKGFCPRELAAVQWSSVLGDPLVYSVTLVSSWSALSVMRSCLNDLISLSGFSIGSAPSANYQTLPNKDRITNDRFPCP